MALSVDMIVWRFIKNKPVIFLIVSLIWAGCHSAPSKHLETLPFYNDAQFDAEWIDQSDPQYSKIHTIDTFRLTSQLNSPITKDSLNGKIYIANFFYSVCPGICPKMTGNLQALQQIFDGNPKFKLVSFSVMPWVDSVARLKSYGESRGVNPAQWYLLTGSKERIYELGRKSYFAEKGLGLKKDSTEFLHTESMLLVDKKARIRGIYNATQKVDVERAADDINILLKEE